MRQRADRSQGNHHAVAVGQSRSGKTEWVRRDTAKGRRVLAWDPDADYDVTRYRSKSGFLQAVRSAGAGPIRAGLTVDATQANFQWFCRVVAAVMSADRPLLVIVEEVADVTHQGKAAGAWGQLIRRGGKYGVSLRVVAQSPAELDKTVLKQAATRVACYLEFPSDRERMADLLGVDRDRLARLPPPKKGKGQTVCHYIVKEQGSDARQRTMSIKAK